jgi:transposase
MLTVETIRKIRLAIQRDGKSIHQTARDLKVSRNTVRKVIRSEQTAFEYRRRVQPKPALGDYVEELDKWLACDHRLPRNQRRSAQVVYEQLQMEGYRGSYDSVRRHVKRWYESQHNGNRTVFIPLEFDPGDAFQFDWSHENVELAGMPVTAKVAHLRLCHSRHFLVVAYPRQTQEMVFDSHIRSFNFFGGVCRRGIYDNMKTAVNKILGGKQRSFNSRFGQLCSHYLLEPVACTPGAGWEKGQVENQVGLVRRRFFTPRPRFKDFAQLNAWLESQCMQWSKTHAHPTLADQTIWEVYQREKAFLMPVPKAFDAYAERPARVSPASLVSFDHNRYSVDCLYVGKTVRLRVYADRIVVVHDGQIIGDHRRRFGRGKTVFDPWHYLSALERKPGALRNGAPFRRWDLPEAIGRVGRLLQERYPDGDRQYVGILQAVPLCGIEAVEAACAKALSMRVISKEVVLNLLHRGRPEQPAEVIDLPARLELKHPPKADCRRYDRMLREAGHGAQ